MYAEWGECVRRLGGVCTAIRGSVYADKRSVYVDKRSVYADKRSVYGCEAVGACWVGWSGWEQEEGQGQGRRVVLVGVG